MDQLKQWCLVTREQWSWGGPVKPSEASLVWGQNLTPFWLWRWRTNIHHECHKMNLREARLTGDPIIWWVSMGCTYCTPCFFVKKTLCKCEKTLRLVCDKVGAQSKVSHGFNLSVLECPRKCPVKRGGTSLGSGRLFESIVYRSTSYMYVIFHTLKPIESCNCESKCIAFGKIVEVFRLTCRLSIPHAMHSPLMAPILPELRKAAEACE